MLGERIFKQRPHEQMDRTWREMCQDDQSYQGSREKVRTQTMTKKNQVPSWKFAVGGNRLKVVITERGWILWLITAFLNWKWLHIEGRKRVKVGASKSRLVWCLVLLLIFEMTRYYYFLEPLSHHSNAIPKQSQILWNSKVNTGVSTTEYNWVKVNNNCPP